MIEYGRAYRYVFENEKWVQNLLLGGVCILIPVIGALVFMGYMCEVLDSLLRDERQPYPNFTFDRFVEYLKRGVWPFLVSLVAGLVSVPISLIGMGGFMAGLALADRQPMLGAPLAICGILLYLGVMLVMNMAMIPLMLRAFLVQEFVASFSWTFVKDFLRRVFWPLVGVLLFIAVTGTLIVIAGMFLCCVGMYPAAALVMFAQFHLYYQLYVLYLARGGQPIPMKTDASS